jgi:hypothetical protein
MSAQTILIICYLLLAVLVLLSLKHSSLARPFKLALVVITSAFYMVTWFHISGLLGWASPDPMPDTFRVHWIHIEEPNKAQGDAGTIYYWVSALDDANLMSSPPRAHRIPWTIDAAEAAQDAKNRLDAGELLNGRISHNVLDGEKPLDEEPPAGKGQTPEGHDHERPAFEFTTVAPPTLPEKTVPIQ